MAPVAVIAPAPASIQNKPYWPAGLPEILGLSSHSASKTATQTTRQSVSPYADISFHPDIAKYEARTARRLRQGGLVKTVPAGWPTKLEGPLVWTPDDFVDEAKYTYYVTEDEKIEVRKALESVKDLHYDAIQPDTFRLPNLGPRLGKLKEQVYNGCGFALLRGFEVNEFDPDERLRVFLGVSSYLAGRRGVQNEQGNVVAELVDYGRVDSDVDLPMHTDITADIVAAFVIKPSVYGGQGTVASAWTIYNELAATRPDLIHTLAEPDWPFDTYGRDPAYYKRPLLFHHDNKVILNFTRRMVAGHPIDGRTEGIPGLTEAQAEALDAIHFLARKHKLAFSTEEGDMRFISNFAILHGREGYSDLSSIPEVASKDLDEEARLSERLILRLWLHDEKVAWSLPPALKLVWARTFSDPDRPRSWRMYVPRQRGPQPGPPQPMGPPTQRPCD